MKCKVKYTKDLKNPVTSGNIKPVKVSAIKHLQEQMIAARAWKRNRGLVVDADVCTLCGEVHDKA